MTVFATSRGPFHVRGEREYPVLPLPLPAADRRPALAAVAQVPAVALFVDRATAVQPDFVLIGRQCRRGGGASAGASMGCRWPSSSLPRGSGSCPSSHSRLVQSSGRPCSRARPAAPGSGTSAGDGDAIAGATATCSLRANQALFRRLAVFAGGFALDAAEAVADPHGDLPVFDGIVALVEQSLLRQVPGRDDEPRYVLLETVREFGLEQLAIAGDVADARQRHAEHFLALSVQFMRDYGIPELMSPDSLAFAGHRMAEQDNIRLALAWLDERGQIEAFLELSSMLDVLWLAQGLYREGQRWLERALARSRGTASVARVQALAGAALLGILQGDYARAEVLLAAGLALARELDDPVLVSAALSNAAFPCYRRGDYARAEALADEALPLLRERTDTWSAPLQILGDTALAQERFDQASRYYQEAIARFQAAPRYVAVGEAWGSERRPGRPRGGHLLHRKPGAGRAAVPSQPRWRVGARLPDACGERAPGLAAVAATSGQGDAGAQLLGAAEGIAATLANPRVSARPAHARRCLAALTMLLGDPAWRPRGRQAARYGSNRPSWWRWTWPRRWRDLGPRSMTNGRTVRAATVVLIRHFAGSGTTHDPTPVLCQKRSFLRRVLELLFLHRFTQEPLLQNSSRNQRFATCIPDKF